MKMRNIQLILFGILLVITSSFVISFSFSKPFRKADLIRQSKFGLDTKLIKIGHFHINKHINFTLKKGSPILAIQEGQVIEICDTCLSGYGNRVIIQHNSLIKALYFHLDSILVKEGDFVLKGEKIGNQGNSGHCSGDVLGFKVYQNDTIINPIDLF